MKYLVESDNKIIAMTKIRDAFASIVNAITVAPNTTNGERKKSLKTIFTPFCA